MLEKEEELGGGETSSGRVKYVSAHFDLDSRGFEVLSQCDQ